MKYSNPEIPEGINTSTDNPLKEFALLSVGMIAIVVGVAFALGYLASNWANKIPFSVEQRIAADHFPSTTKAERIETYLNELAGKLAQAEQLPGGMSVTVHYGDGDMVNAFATLGGNIVMLRGLLEKLPNENALAMVLAHEIAHVKHRDPIRSIGRGVVIGVALSMVSATLGNAVTDQLLTGGGMATVLHFSREQESAADETALDALRAVYGHVEGAADLFGVLEKSNPDPLQVEFFSSHPLTQNRIERIRAATGQDQGQHAVQPLPGEFRAWMRETGDADAPSAPPP